jgi:hypothetical protein
VINDAIDQKELLFQTIIDMGNNKEIQKVIQKHEISQVRFFNPSISFFQFTPQVITKASLNHMYFVGLILSKIINKLKIRSIVEHYQVNNQEMQKEITAVIKKDITLHGEMTQLSTFKCDCENENTSWNFPILCMLLWPIVIFLVVIEGVAIFIFHLNYLPFISFLAQIIVNIGLTLNCFWTKR